MHIRPREPYEQLAGIEIIDTEAELFLRVVDAAGLFLTCLHTMSIAGLGEWVASVCRKLQS